MNSPSIVVLLLLSAATPVWAAATPIPEPGVLELLAIGAVAAIAVAIRKRRK